MWASRAVEGWLESPGLTIAEEKAEADLNSKRRKRNDTHINIGNHMVISKFAFEYLGVMMDTVLRCM